MSKKERGEVEMDGEDVMKVEVYKERKEHWKWDRKGEERNRRKSIERRK